MKRLRLALLSGGISSEREVSLNSGKQVYNALDKEKYEIVCYDPKYDLAKLVAEAPGIDAALIILHGPFGEDGTVQGLFDLLDIPYQGSGVLGSAVAMNKLVAKQLYEKAGLTVPAYRVFDKGQEIDYRACVEALGLPLVVKPVELGSSVGMTIVRDIDQFPQAMQKAFSKDNCAMVETFIDGTELTAGVMGNDDLEAFPLIEIIPNKDYEFFDYDAKYTPGATSEICPARISEADRDKAQKDAMAAHRALACRGYSRTDMILKDGEVFILETNTIPGMTATSLLPQAAAKAGYSFGALLDRLIELGIEAHAARKGRG